MFQFKYNNISIISPVNIYDLSFLEIHKQIGQHSELKIKANILASEENLSSISANNIEISVSNNTVFKGTLDYLNISMNLESFNVDMSASGYSKLLDITKKNRSFQDENNPYNQIFNQIICEEYNGSFINTTNKSTLQEKMYIQYNETDWQFLKRLSSYLNTFIIPNDLHSYPSIYLGNIKRRLENLKLETKISKKIFNSNYNFPDGEYLEITTTDILDLSDGLLIDGAAWWVVGVKHVFKLGQITSTYTLTQDELFENKDTISSSLSGISIGGKIIDVISDKIKLHLDIDEYQDTSIAKWHAFSTAYTAENSAGWYVMPQIGDQAMLYFPDRFENNSFVKNIYRSLDGENTRHVDPNIKYWGTYDEKELKMDSDSIKISANEDYIYTWLSNNDGISVDSIHNINISTGADLLLNGNKISVCAQKGNIEVLTGNSKIKIDKDTTFKSTIIKEKANL